MKTLLTAAVLAGLSFTPAHALEFLVGEERADSSLNSYEFGLIELALQKADGDHTVSRASVGEANQSRLLEELATGSADFHIIFSGIDQERFDKLATVPIPLQRGLLGHRVLIVSEDSKNKVAAVKTIEDLKNISIGSGTGWPDTQILEAAGLKVSDAKYENLFKMVEGGRIDGFARGVAEPYAEVSARSGEMPSLTIDESIIIVYPFDMFLFLNKDDKERYDILMQGFTRAYEDGSFMEYFENHPRIKEVFEQAKIDDRIRFEIENPLLPKEIAAIPDQFWHGR
ncbi:hypothetical protein JM93_00078 [Roseibium hamelinense]|uniref:Uncharacterized protein n=1 Tax=Roseibium hamelinense TaxID=150831 RepID=A0A562TI37_9HYPH|nr:hypothetical protein [Roseibium hamelinense]MTI43117.1 hypothetical protein [Roseibium hamelinense]TWI92536.1 hypothetical protein JM93_00078 [Roseibium hamelinense]